MTFFFFCKFTILIIVFLIFVKGGLLGMDVSEDGQMIATSGEDHFVHVWKISCNS